MHVTLPVPRGIRTCTRREIELNRQRGILRTQVTLRYDAIVFLLRERARARKSLSSFRRYNNIKPEFARARARGEGERFDIRREEGVLICQTVPAVRVFF